MGDIFVSEIKNRIKEKYPWSGNGDVVVRQADEEHNAVRAKYNIRRAGVSTRRGEKKDAQGEDPALRVNAI
jgi:hypothetical protein